MWRYVTVAIINSWGYSRLIEYSFDPVSIRRTMIDWVVFEMVCSSFQHTLTHSLLQHAATDTVANSPREKSCKNVLSKRHVAVVVEQKLVEHNNNNNNNINENSGSTMSNARKLQSKCHVVTMGNKCLYSIG